MIDVKNQMEIEQPIIAILHYDY